MENFLILRIHLNFLMSVTLDTEMSSNYGKFQFANIQIHKSDQ